MVKLSVIIPVYNKIRYVARILDQLRMQIFSDFECLLIDDGSTDGSGAVCDEFAAKDSRFRVFHIPNGGVSHARNVGLDHAQGAYITFIDSDDGIRPDYLENLVRCAESSGADLVISGYQKVSEDGSILQTVIPSRTGLWKFSDILPEFAQTQLQTGLFGCCVAKIFTRTLVKNIRFDETLRLAEDFDFYLNLYEIIETIYLDDHSGYLYLQDAENSTGNAASENIDYLAQLHIWLHCRTMLQNRGVWDGENWRLVESRLSDYAFFVLFHTPLPHYRERFETLYDLYAVEQLPLTGGNMLRRWLFICLHRRRHHTAQLTMTLYRLARKLRR